MYIKEEMDFDKVKSEINPSYLQCVEFLESILVSQTLSDEILPLTFQYEKLQQHWNLHLLDKRGLDFTIACSKVSEEIDIECLSTYEKLSYLNIKPNKNALFDCFEKKYKVKINRENSIFIDVPIKCQFYIYVEFLELPTIKQISQIYRDIFH